MANAEDMFVVTGGPGSGKSSLIDTMARRGFHTMPEAGRAIIQDHVRIGGSALPWADRELFAELMLNWELRSYHAALASDAPVIMDRGIPDVGGYLTLCGLPVPAHIEAAAKIHPYNKRVFLAPYRDAIFAQDAERKQDRQEAEATGRLQFMHGRCKSGLGFLSRPGDWGKSRQVQRGATTSCRRSVTRKRRASKIRSR